MFRSLLFWLLVSSGIGYWLTPELIGFEVFDSSPWLIWTLIVITMYSLGLLVRRDELAPLREKPWWVVLGTLTQMIVMPAAVFAMTKIVTMDPEIAAGVILVGCVPGAMASNVLTHTAGGSVAYSVSLTAVATLLSPVSVPFVLWCVADLRSEISLWSSSLLLAGLVVMPTVLGYATSHGMPRWRAAADVWCPRIASVALLWIIAAVVAGNRDKLGGIGVVVFFVLLIVNLIGYAAGYGVGAMSRLPESFRRALTLEVGMQNAGLGTGLAVSMFGSQTSATIPTAAYTFGCMLTGSILASVWKFFDTKRGCVH
ncbi:bile acid:sodium symporter family protein [Rubripirellula amarantea]|nr:bile acid:sodium symporter family protein [Rubripirellula amarantea]